MLHTFAALVQDKPSAIIIAALCLSMTSSCLGAQIASRSIVKPCTNSEWQVAFSEEAKALTESKLKNWGGFSSCAAVATPLLPTAQILRLQTPVNVDASYTATLIRASKDQSLRLISSGRGIMYPPAQPENPESIATFNSLLDNTAITLTKANISTLTDLYFFILDDERGDRMRWKRKALGNGLNLNANARKNVIKISGKTADVRLSDPLCFLTFKLNDNTIQLSSVQTH